LIQVSLLADLRRGSQKNESITALELEQLIFDAGWDYNGDLAWHYPETP